MFKMEHIGIAVKDLAASQLIFEKLLGFEHYKTEVVESEQVKTCFYQTGETKLELLEGQGEDNVIKKFIEKKGEGIHHIAFEVKNIDQEMDRLKALGFEFVTEKPKKGADNKMICFLHPKKTNGILIELCQEIHHS